MYAVLFTYLYIFNFLPFLYDAAIFRFDLDMLVEYKVGHTYMWLKV